MNAPIAYGRIVTDKNFINRLLFKKAGEISFQDPIYAYWLKTEYFAK